MKEKHFPLLGLKQLLTPRTWGRFGHLPVLLGFLIFLSLLSQPTQANAQWEEQEEDLWKLESPELILYRTNLEKFELDIKTSAPSSPNELPDRTEILVNASFFDTTFRPLGLILKGGKILNKPHLGGSVLTGVLIQKNGILGIKHRDQLATMSLSAYDLAIQAGPRIIAEGRPLKLKNPDLAERRSGICLNAQRELIIYVTNKTTVINFPDLQKILLLKDISCHDALNLDGGSSTQYYYYQNGELKDSIVGFSTVPTFLHLKRKLP